MADEEFFRHIHRMSRLTRALKAPLDAWEAEVLRRTTDNFGERMARAVRRHLDEAFIELVTGLDPGIRN
ncbi:MAG: hypothetical protein ABSG85_08550 [Spirochaetia bacterium]|jgi:hypothetical protein